MKKFLILFFVFMFIGLDCTASVLPSETDITIRPKQEINADYIKEGDTVIFETVENVLNDDKIVISKGTSVFGKVKKKRNNFIFGTPGYITLGDFEMRANDGSKVTLSGTISNMGTARYWTVLPGVLVIPLLFIKGNDGKISGNTIYTLYTVGD